MVSRPVRAVIFDFGGTLANIAPTHQWLFLRACHELGIDVDPERIADAENVGWEPYQTPLGPAHVEASVSGDAFARFKTALLEQRLAAAGVEAPPEVRRAAAARIYQLDTDPAMYRLYDDAVPTLEALKGRGLTLGVLSNHEWDLPNLVDGLGIGRYMQAVVTSARVGYRKPHPRMFQAICEAMGVAPDEALMVGDSVSADVEGARAFGMRALYLQRGDGPAPMGVPTVQSLNGVLHFV